LRFVVLVVVTAWMIARFAGDGSLRRRVVVLFLVVLFGSSVDNGTDVIGMSIVATTQRGLAVLRIRCVVLCLLAGLLALPPLHPGLFKQAPLLGQAFPLLPVFDFILPDQRPWRLTKDILVLAELADPGL
jgi:hypothetical protein